LTNLCDNSQVVVDRIATIVGKQPAFIECEYAIELCSTVYSWNARSTPRSFLGVNGGRRVSRATARLLRQQRVRLDDVVEIHATAPGIKGRVQLIGDQYRATAKMPLTEDSRPARRTRTAGRS
jgi:hypothetical protein